MMNDLIASDFFFSCKQSILAKACLRIFLLSSGTNYSWIQGGVMGMMTAFNEYYLLNNLFKKILGKQKATSFSHMILSWLQK